MFRTGYRTVEFWVTLLTVVAVFLAGMQEAVPPEYALYLTTAIAVAYAASRAITKWGEDLKRGYHSSEFMVAALSIALGVFQTTQTSIPTEAVGLCATITAATIAAMRAFSKPNPLADKFHPALIETSPPVDTPDALKDEGDGN